ncbi:MAG: hypothetical protein QOH83_258, partial [Solirubrobacteraceae bacterium]|nr:hypothetical protein [Solirubrobacteraceae bacterium]
YIQRVVETQIGRALLGGQILDGATIQLDSDANADELVVTWRNPEASPSPNGSGADADADAESADDTEPVGAGSSG